MPADANLARGAVLAMFRIMESMSARCLLLIAWLAGGIGCAAGGYAAAGAREGADAGAAAGTRDRAAPRGAAGATGAGEPVRHEYTAVHMGMPVRIVLYADGDPASAHAAGRLAARAAFDRIAALDDRLSDYRPDSELRRLAARPLEWVPVSPELFAVLGLALEVARVSGGAFDPTVAPLVALWREALRDGRTPPAAALDSARALVGWRRIELDSTGRRVRLAVPGMRLDLGGVAKGYILDEARAVLRAHGVTRVLVEAGGDVVAGDAPPGRAGWRIDVPGADPAFAALAAELSNAALATSGAAAQFVEVDGVRYSHVVDPRSGVALTHARTARVIACSGAAADALATALGVLRGSRDLVLRSGIAQAVTPGREEETVENDNRNQNATTACPTGKIAVDTG